MVVMAERLQLTEPEQLIVTVVGNDMIGDVGGNDFRFLQAHRAERMLIELVLASACPAPVIVPALNTHPCG